jgi:hypothetical protein
MQENTFASMCGIGGSHLYYQERAILIFNDEKNNPVYHGIMLSIQKLSQGDLTQNPNLLWMPCLLGRDILSNWELQYNHGKTEVWLIVP